MDVEFHYHVTYLVAARAGLAPDQARLLARACQAVDDNDTVFEVDAGLPTAYRSYISQTMDILKPARRLMRIYPVFHFVPGAPAAPSAARRDGAMHWLNTTPGNRNAEELLAEALAASPLDVFRTAVAVHAYTDSWAHQNFVGSHHVFNGMKGALGKAAPDVGHADAGHRPDRVGLVWRDPRLAPGLEDVDNTARFLDAAARLFVLLKRRVDPGCTPAALAAEKRGLRADLRRAFGPPDPEGRFRHERLAAYRSLAALPRYGGAPLEDYRQGAWFEEAVEVAARGVHDQGTGLVAELDPLAGRCLWRDRTGFRSSRWYRFQEAVKAHQAAALELLGRRNLRHVDSGAFESF